MPVSLGIVVTTCSSGIPEKKWFAVLWGKTRQLGKLGVVDAVEIIRKYIPVVSTCVAQCDNDLPVALNLANLSGNAFQRLVSRAVMVVGVQAPEQGTTVAEALSCGTFVVARGRNLGFEFAAHPLTRRFRNPNRELDGLVRSILADLGFDFSLPWDAQPSSPDVKAVILRRSERPLLPPRYTNPACHAKHVQAIFGIDESCAVRSSSKSAEAVSFVQASLGKPLRQGWKCPS